MRAEAATTSAPISMRFKVDGLDCQNEVRTLRAAVGPLVGGDDKLSFNTKTGVMEVLSANALVVDDIRRTVATTGMQAHLLENSPQQSALLFRVEGLDCKNEVAALKSEVGPLVGGEDWLTFDTAKGLMTVAPQQVATADDIIDRVVPTGMRASLVADGTSETLLYRVHGLDCKNEVAALTRELSTLVGKDKLAFDTARGMMTVAPQNRSGAGVIEEAVARTGMRAERWSPPEGVSSAAEPTASDGAACGCGAEAREALSPSIPTHMPGQIVFRIHGMDCADEIAALKREVGPLVGEDKLAFDLLNGRMSIDAMSDATLEARIEKAVARAGMRAESWSEGSDSAAAQDEERRKRVQSWLTIASGAFAALGFAVHAWLAGGVLTAFEAGEHGLGSTPLPSMILYTLAVLCAVRYVAPKAWLAAKRLRPDMNLLMTVAVAGAIGIGAWFEAATVSFFFALALALETWSLGRARRAVAALMELAPPTARVRFKDGSERDVPAAEVRVGSHIIIRPGDKIPLDGKVAAGESEINQAPITGESVPVFKEAGDEVFAGTINGEGALDVLTTKAASDTTLAQIIRMVGSAQSRRAPSEQWVEKFARIYTPVVMILAVAIFLVPPLLLGGAWDVWFYRALVLLVIACPCALVISTPVTIVAALAGAAKQGVLVKGGIHLETPARLSAIAMDKTGTLTEGRPQVVEVVALGGRSEAEILRSAAALEARSEHPIARAILAKAAELKIVAEPAEAVQAITGRGVIGRFAGREMWLGSRRYVEERGVNPDGVLERADALSSAGRTMVAVGDDQEVWGLVAVADAVRPEATEIVAALHRAGIKHVVMLTGDNRATAEAIAKQTGIDEVRAELLPGDKVSAVEDLVRLYGSVAMVGDGVNDAPAMGRATLGIAMGAMGTDAAIETADVALMSDDLSRLPWLVRHSRATMAVIRQNVAFSIAVKLLFTALTVLGLASLWGAIAADVGASLLVVLNGLRLLNRGQNIEHGGPSGGVGVRARRHHAPVTAETAPA